MGKYLGEPLFKSHITIIGRLQRALETNQTTSGRQIILPKDEQEQIEIVIKKFIECIDILEKIK